MIVTARDASRCIGSFRSNRPIPTLDRKRVYTLPELVDIAEMANPEGRIAWEAAKRSLELAGVDRALYLPLITLAGQGSDVRAIVPFPKPIAPRGYVTVEQPIVAAQLQLEYSLLDFGRGAKVDGSKALEIASTLRLSRVHQKIAYSTSAGFYQTQQASGHLEAAQMILQTAETLLQNAQSQFDNGRATLPDVQNAQAGVAEARFDLAAAVGEVKKTKLALTESIGVEPTTEIEIQPQQNDSPDPMDRNVEELIQTAWKSRPDLLARAQEVRRAKDAYRAAHAAYLPVVGFDATGGQTSTWPTADWGELGPASVTTWSAEVKLRWELFNGARRHEVAAALAEQRSAVEEQRAAQDSVTREVWAAYVDYQTALEQQRSSQSFLQAAQTSYDSSLDAYKYGVRSLVDVVQSERELAQARLAVVRSQAQFMQSAVALGYATGDLLKNTTSPTGVHP
ncbi:TolC family protein [Granulicella sp. WH15]|uniref:TolC family protein n=1 Tax=Granulicella sp. WH15 TaxID=2602070 RepID=UPI00210296DA|nr:TolC family protein [Granulicella sp. WH15]